MLPPYSSNAGLALPAAPPGTAAAEAITLPKAQETDKGVKSANETY